MESATWDICRADFAFDGSLLDLLVPETGPNEWKRFWSALRAGPFALRAYREGEPIPLPESAAAAFAESVEACVTLSVVAGAVTANCHHFSGDLKLDIDPREITSESAFESVLVIMRLIAAAVGLSVVAVADGGTPAYAFLRVSPDGQAEFLPAGSVRRP